MAKCDLCGNDCAAHQLKQLLESYRTTGVEDLCPACGKWADKIKSDMLLEIGPRLRAAITERKGMPTPPKPWWRRLIAGHWC